MAIPEEYSQEEIPPDVGEMGPDHQRKAYQILRWLCAGGKLHCTCRQVGNLKGRAQRELAEDHPLKQIYEKRLNTIKPLCKAWHSGYRAGRSHEKAGKRQNAPSMAYLYHNTRDTVGEFAKKYGCDHVCV